MEGRYDYIPADSSAGVIIIDEKFSYSFHATDPACGQLLNAFDVVRVHKFQEDDPKKSFKAMAKFASEDEEVKLLIFKERQDSAVEDFDEGDPDAWKKKLEYEDKSLQLKNTLRNLTLILENDPNLKDIVFNQHLDGMEIKGDVPWRHPSKFWRDADDAQLISYVDENYGTFSQRNFDIAVAKVTDDRSYHPIREFLQALPEWDKVERVDTLLIDYLGAADNKYVRAVTRKTLCAAACRVLNPGCKFDTMLVLNGSQGIGKSTLIARLGGEWFSDSLSLNDTKDKTAAEKLQGYWILEIGELAGLRKAEVETLRSFLSRQNDIYRASFGKRTTPHPRQCVFFGTTNAESGYTLMTSVLNAIKNHIDMILEAEQLLELVESLPENQQNIFNYDAQIVKLKEEIERNKTFKLKLYENLQEGMIGQDEYFLFKKSYAMKIQEAEQAIAAIEAEREQMVNNNREQLSWTEVFKQYQNITEVTRNVVVDLIDHIEILEGKGIHVVFRYHDNWDKLIAAVSNIPADMKSQIAL